MFNLNKKLYFYQEYKMIKMIRKIKVFVISIIAISISLAGCMTQSIDAGSGGAEEITPGGPAKPVATVDNIPVNTSIPETTEDVSDWWGTIKSTPAGAQYDDYFERQDLGQVIMYGIDSIDPEVSSQIKALRNSGKIVHLYGKLDKNIPDYNGSQIQPDRIVVEE
jgi:hypothetical protein